MNKPEVTLLYSFSVLYFPTLAMYHLMVFRVNRWLPPDRRIPHSLSLIGWGRLAAEYKRFYPRSRLYWLTVACAVGLLVVAAIFVIFRVTGYSFGR